MSGGPMRIPRDRLDLAKVRHPREHLLLALSVLANAAVIVGAAALLYLAPEWLSERGRVSAVVERIRVAGVAAIVLLPVLGFLRLGRWATFRENSVRLGRDQVPEVFAILERHCRALGVDPPELYASTVEAVGTSTAFMLTRGRWFIVLGPDLFAGLERIQDRADALSYVLAYELGRLALGQAGWWEELMLSYLKRIPLLHLPLLTVQTASRDRFAATLAPEGVREFILLAAGGDLLDHVDVAAFVHQALSDDTPPAWSWLGKQGIDGPHLTERVRDLYRAGFLDIRALVPGTEPLAPGHPAAAEAVDERPQPPTSH